MSKETCRPSASKPDDVLRLLGEESDKEELSEYLEKRLQLIRTVGAGRDSIRFSLDPLCEYLASERVIEHCGSSKAQWQDTLHRIHAQQGAPETIKGFLLALQDCCEHHGKLHGVPESVIEEIEQLPKTPI